MNFQPVIGIEIHVELKTKSKMFSSGPVTFGKMPNTQTVIYDLGFPGVMPKVNKNAVRFGIQVCKALNMKIDRTLYFDRKNYFYSDLPKGYQITQQDHPIGSDGYIEVETSSGTKRIGIERAHLEEDTAKQFHLGDMSLVDYNRSGTPLIEIVSKPEIRSGEEAAKYVEGIKEIVTYLGVSDGKMEEGNLRCDINISLMPYGSKVFGTKVEIKNLNSIANVKAALDYEIVRQSEILLSGGTIDQETRRYDESKKSTVLMRKKTNAVDYKYFRDSNIIPVKMSEDFIENTINDMEKLPSYYRKTLKALNLSSYEIEELIRSKEFVIYFLNVMDSGCQDAKLLWNYLMVDLMSYLNKKEISLPDLKFSQEDLKNLINMIYSKEINSKQAKELLELMVETGKSPLDLKNELGLEQVNDVDALLEIVKKVLSENQQSISDFKAGKDKALGYIVGQVMKMSQGKANPAMAKEMILKEIQEY